MARILLLTHSWFPDHSVPQRRWDWLTGLLVTLGHEVLVLTSSPGDSKSSQTDQDAVSVSRVNRVSLGDSLSARMLSQTINSVNMLTEILRLRGSVRRFDPDLVVATVPELPTALVGFVGSRILNVPSVLDLRDAWPNLIDEASRWNEAVGPNPYPARAWNKRGLKLSARYAKVFLEVLFSKFDGIITTSSWLAAEIQRELGKRNSRQRIVTIRNVFPLGHLSTKIANTPREPETIRVLYAGTIGRAQGLDNVLHAALKFRGSNARVLIKILGDGAGKEWLQDQARRMNLKMEVQIAGPVPAQELEPYYAWADTVLVHLADWPSLHFTVPSKLYEVMVCGKHVTAVASGETAELVSSLGAGACVPPGNPNALAELWQELAQSSEGFDVPDLGREWVNREQRFHVPKELELFLAGVIDRGDRF